MVFTLKIKKEILKCKRVGFSMYKLGKKTYNVKVFEFQVKDGKKHESVLIFLLFCRLK